MFRKKKRKRISYIPQSSVGSFTTSDNIKAIVAEFECAGKEYCLDVGSSENPDDIYQHLNFLPFPGVDFYGDVRCLFAPGYMERIDEYPELKRILNHHYKIVKLVDIAEHIEWIHQESLFRWVYNLLAEGGIVYVVTPNLDFVVHLYQLAMQRVAKGASIDNFPFNSHEYLKRGRDCDIARWANSILYSGCSATFADDGKLRGDFHHACYNRLWLEEMLTKEMPNGGFMNVQIYDGERLEAVAQKPYVPDHGAEELVRRILE